MDYEKNRQIYITVFIALFSIIILMQISRTIQEAPEIEISYNQYPQWHLPDGAKLRLGKGAINKIAFSHDNTTLAVATTIGLWLYDGQSGKELALLMPHISVNTIAFSPDGKTLASGGDDKLVRLWNMPEGTHRQTLIGHRYRIFNVVFSADGKTLASTSTRETNLWDITTNTHKQAFHRFHFDREEYIAFNHAQVIVTDVNRNANTVEIEYLGNENQNITFDANLPVTWTMTFSSDGKVLAYEIEENKGRKTYRKEDHSIILRNVDTGELVQKFKNTSEYVVESMTFSANGKTLITADLIKSTLTLWDVETGQEKKTISCDPHRPRFVSISPDGKSLVSWSDAASFYLWDISTGTSKQVITEHLSCPHFPQSSLSADGKILVSSDGLILRDNFYLSDITTGKQIKIYDGHSSLIRDAELNPDGTILATCSEDKTIGFWDVTTGKKLKTIRTKEGYFTNLAFSPDGKILAGASENKEIYLWNADSGRRKKTLTGLIDDTHRLYFSLDLFFSPDGKHLSCVSNKGVFYVWDVSTGKQNEIFSEQLKNVSNAAFSPDGSTLAITFKHDYKNTHSGEPKKSHHIELWNVPDATKQHTFIGHTNDVTNAIFSPDGKTLATGSEDKTIRLWDVNTGQQKHILRDQSWILRDQSWILRGERHSADKHFQTLSFSPDGKILANGINHGPIYLWNTETGEQKKILQGHTKCIKDISFSTDGGTLTSMNGDGTVLVWDIASILSPTNKSD